MSDKPIDADCAGKLTILPGERVDELQQAGLRILQKEQGFRFGMDAVLLSSFVRAESRDRCADFGTGTGILPLLLAGMGRAKSVDAFEIQPDMANMARRSVLLNGLEHIIRIHALPVESADEVLAPGSIDVIVCNPPYGERLSSSEEVKKIYRDFSRAFFALPDWSGYILTAFPEFERAFSRRANAVKRLSNANLPCGLYCYFGKKPFKENVFIK